MSSKNILLQIAPEIKVKCPKIQLGCMHCKVSVQTQHPALWAAITQTVEDISGRLQSGDERQLPNIVAARTAYKQLGKDPSRYRLSAEALLRRIVKGKGIYQINNVVDTLNLISIKTGYSIGGYDADKIAGKITFRIGQAEPYAAIGRGDLNIEFLPTFSDTQSAFGTPTSDSVRTMVSANTQHFLMVIIDFEGNRPLLEETLAQSVTAYTKYARGADFNTWVIT